MNEASTLPLGGDGFAFPGRLADAREIARYIDETSPGFVDTELVEEYFCGASASLRLVPAGEVREGHPDGNARSASKERRYAAMDPATMPPLVIEDGEVADGNHRLRGSRRKGLLQLWCYVVVRS